MFNESRWIQRLLNKIGWRKDTIVCMRQEATWCWEGRLGKRTSGNCSKCDSPIFFEEQNKVFVKICHKCAGL